MFSDSIFYFPLCLSPILFVALFAFYAIDQIGAIAGYVMFCCVCYITALIRNAVFCAQHFAVFTAFFVANVSVCTLVFFVFLCVFLVICSGSYKEVS